MAAGKFAQAAAAGRVFSVSTVVAGLAIPISTTTAPTLLLWNPQDSGVIVNLLRFSIGHVSTNTVAGAIGMQLIGPVGGGAGATTPITAFAASTPLNALAGGGWNSRIKASAAGTNTILATTSWTSVMFEPDANVLSGAGLSNDSGNALVYDFDGLLQFGEGFAVYPVASAATGTLYAQTLYWEEILRPDYLS